MTRNRSQNLGTIMMVILLVGMIVGIAPHQAWAAPAQQAEATTWTVLTGAQAEVEQTEAGPAGAWQLLNFYPNKITINVGDTILWKLNSAEPHTVTFPAPGEQPPALLIPEGGGSQGIMMNPLAVFPQGTDTYSGTVLTGSGQMGAGPQFPTEYKLTFTKAGTYDYNCLFHSMMTGTVVVQDAGTAYPQTQDQIDAEAQAQIEADTQAAMQAEAQAQQVTNQPGPNGTTIYAVNVGWGNGKLAYMRFSPQDLSIHVGDTVEWTQQDVETPHTVTFTSGGTVPEFVLTEPQQSGPPKVVVNPDVLAPAGGSTYSGQGYFNSGLIFGTQVPLPGSRSYSLVFDTPGTYDYVCVIHDEFGMVGKITVLAAGTPSQLPTTGGPGTASGPWWVALLGLGLFAGGLLVFAVWRRSRTMSG
jgi:plastocyanin